MKLNLVKLNRIRGIDIENVTNGTRKISFDNKRYFIIPADFIIISHLDSSENKHLRFYGDAGYILNHHHFESGKTSEFIFFNKKPEVIDIELEKSINPVFRSMKKSDPTISNLNKLISKCTSVSIVFDGSECTRYIIKYYSRNLGEETIWIYDEIDPELSAIYSKFWSKLEKEGH